MSTGDDTPIDVEEVDENPVGDDDAAPKGQPEDEFAKVLSDGLFTLGKLATGVAGKVLGPRADLAADEPSRTVTTPELDDAIEKAGATVGHWLRSAGDGMSENPADPAEAVDAAREKAREGQAETASDDDGWSPLVQGAKVFSEGVGAVAGELLDTLADQTSRDKKPKTYAQAGEE